MDAPPAAGLKPTAIVTRADLRLRSERTALRVKRMRTLALPFAPTLAAPEPSCERFGVPFGPLGGPDGPAATGTSAGPQSGCAPATRSVTVFGVWQPPERSGMSAIAMPPPYCHASLLPSGENDGECMVSGSSAPLIQKH